MFHTIVDTSREKYNAIIDLNVCEAVLSHRWNQWAHVWSSKQGSSYRPVIQTPQHPNKEFIMAMMTTVNFLDISRYTNNSVDLRLECAISFIDLHAHRSASVVTLRDGATLTNYRLIATIYNRFVYLYPYRKIFIIAIDIHSRHIG